MLKKILEIITTTIVILALLTVLTETALCGLDDTVETFKRHLQYKQDAAHGGH